MGARAKAFFSVAAIALALLCFWLWRFMPTQGWEHINLTGDYLWRSSAKIGGGKFRPLRPLQPA